jgi:hypothetical protein
MNPGGRSRPVSVSGGEYVEADRLQRAHGVPQIELGFYPDDMSRKSFEGDTRIAPEIRASWDCSADGAQACRRIADL